MDTAHLTAPFDPGPVDLAHLDATLANLRRAERAIGAVAAGLAEARDRVAAAPSDPEARRAVRTASLRMRGEAAALADQLAALVREGAP